MFEERYPNTTRFIEEYGWIEIGVSDSYDDESFIKAFDEGGTIWQGKPIYESLDQAMRDLEKAITIWFEQVL